MASERYLTVFCSAKDVDELYVREAEKFADLMLRYHYHLVWGGSNVGIMNVISERIKMGGGKLIGVTVDFLKNVARADCDKLYVMPTIGERKRILLERGDAIVTLAGGIGTIAEVTEIIDLKKMGRHEKPIVIVNTNHLYDGLLLELDTMEKQKFLPVPLEKLVHFAPTPEFAMAYLNTTFGEAR